MMLLVLGKWAYFPSLWEHLTEFLMLIMRRFTLRECPFIKERYVENLTSIRDKINLNKCKLHFIIRFYEIKLGLKSTFQQGISYVKNFIIYHFFSYPQIKSSEEWKYRNILHSVFRMYSWWPNARESFGCPKIL